ncbi:hypothetical protein CO661_00305 [Sinorhizobium fredii]|uniref:Uncharacterized protein n=1 Tax=Rhizobium fredii TaxID=380 RepID=A0A2A6M673_RHIFR|nr:hypothetical protein [Sinorhizobium fredii]PDT50145.1 hypothetical protein CO661_00305 [Sinorhizobium fredii]
MKNELITELRKVGEADNTDVLMKLKQVIATYTGPSMTAEGARNAFSKVLAKARNGDMQLVGRKTSDMAVVISLRDLAALIRSSSQSVGSALDEVGFRPLGRRLVVSTRKDHKP